MSKAANLLALLWLLRSRGRLTAAELASALEVAPRTVYRYVDALCASGVPIVAEPGPGGGYRLTDGFRGTPLFFSPEELAALHGAARLVGSTGHPASPALEEALAKLQRTLTPEQLAGLESELGAVAFSVERRDLGGPAALGALLESARTRRVVRIRYRKPGEAPEDRIVEPHRVAWRRGAWYLEGWDRQRRAPRTFRVHRIEAVQCLDETFALRPELLNGEDDPSQWVPERLERARRTITVRLRSSQRGVRVSLAEHWYLRHCLIRQDGDVLVFRIDPTGYRHLPRFLLGFATDVSVLHPDGLRRAVARLAAAVQAHHRDGDGAVRVNPDRF